MTVHVFGAVSSSTHALLLEGMLRITIPYFLAVIDSVKKNLWMDDLLKSLSSEWDSIIMALCKRGGFNLTKSINNSREVLQSLPEEHKSKNLKTTDGESFRAAMVHRKRHFQIKTES